MHQSGEDYLEAILQICEANGQGKVRTTDIALKLGVSKPSVSKAMNNLKEEGYILQESYGEIYLTKKGKVKATQIYNRHRILTQFFEGVLGVDSETAEKDACLIEHDISDITMQKLEEFVKRFSEK